MWRSQMAVASTRPLRGASGSILTRCHNHGQLVASRPTRCDPSPHFLVMHLRTPDHLGLANIAMQSLVVCLSAAPWTRTSFQSLKARTQPCTAWKCLPSLPGVWPMPSVSTWMTRSHLCIPQRMDELRRMGLHERRPAATIRRQAPQTTLVLAAKQLVLGPSTAVTTAERASLDQVHCASISTVVSILRHSTVIQLLIF